MVVIDAAAGYVPLYRIDRAEIAAQHGGNGRGESAVPARDENHVTMVVEAAETALKRSSTDIDDVGAVFTASISDRFAEHGIAAQLACRFGAPDDVRTGNFQATGRAAADAIAMARQYARATDRPVVVAAADIMPVEPGADEEHTVGAGAGALVLCPDADSPAATIDAVGRATTGFLERHREHGESAIQGDSRFERRHGVEPAVSMAVDRMGRSADPEYAVVSAPSHRFARTALDAIGEDAEHVSTFESVGYAGTATLLLDMAHALESVESEASTVALAYGQGGADAFALSVTDRPDDLAGVSVAAQLDAKEYVPYAKHLEYRERHDYQGVPNP